MSPRRLRPGHPAQLPGQIAATDLLAEPDATSLPWPDPPQVHELVEQLMDGLAEAVDVATPDVLDGLISNWSDQWEALADAHYRAELAHWTQQEVRAQGQLARAEEELRALLARRQVLAQQLGVPQGEAPGGSPGAADPVTDPQEDRP
jgi:hypothetical protein